MMDRQDWQLTWDAIYGLLGSKWSFHVLRLLADGPRGFNEMKRSLHGVTAKTLSRRLKELRCAGVVDKRVKPTSPPTTSYRLTERGEIFADALRDLESFVEPVPCDCASEDACAVVPGEEGSVPAPEACGC